MSSRLSLTVVVQVATQGLASVDVVAHIQLLVDGVSTVITTAHRQQKDLGSKLFLESQSDWDRTTLTSKVGLDVPNVALEAALKDSLKGSETQ